MPLSEIAHIDKTTQEHQNVSTINSVKNDATDKNSSNNNDNNDNEGYNMSLEVLSQSKASSSSENQTEPLESTPPTTGSFNQFSINQEKSNNASQNNSPQSQSKPKPFTCLECNQTFSRQHNLKSHALTHSKEKPYRCDVCQHFFRRQHDLKRHLKLHTGEKPHQCQHCKRKFARMDALNRHLRAETFCGGPQKKIFQGQDSKTKIELSVQQPLQQATPQQISQPQLPSSTSIIPASQPQPQPGKATQQIQTTTPAIKNEMQYYRTQPVLHSEQYHHSWPQNTNNQLQTMSGPQPPPQSSGKQPLIIPNAMHHQMVFESTNGGVPPPPHYPVQYAPPPPPSSHTAPDFNSQIQDSQRRIVPEEAITNGDHDHVKNVSQRENSLIERNNYLEERVRELENDIINERKLRGRREFLEQRVSALEIEKNLLKQLLLERASAPNTDVSQYEKKRKMSATIDADIQIKTQKDA
nr:2867_t:CDS:2 [Entrophospora candida]